MQPSHAVPLSAAASVCTTDCVTCIDDLFRWPAMNSLASTRHGISDPDNTLQTGMHATKSITSAFSGVCAETVASNMMHCYCQQVTGDTTAKFQHLASVERDTECRLEQTVLPNGPTCRFPDIINFVSSDVMPTLKSHMNAGTCDLDDLAPLLLKPGAVKTTAPCTAHGTTCHFPRATGHSAGCPCTDFTSWGKRRRLGGPTVPYYLIWLAMRLLLREFWVLFENVPQFPTELLSKYLGHIYDISEVLLCPTQLGSRVKRPRKFILLTLKLACHISRPLSLLPTMFGRCAADGFSWRDYFCASSAELGTELRWGKARVSKPDANTFEEVLLPSEATRLAIYIDKHSVQNCVCNLSQNPEFVRAAGRARELHTLIQNSVVLWSCEHSRWMTGREMLLANSFPVSDSHLQVICGNHSKREMSSFNRSRVAYGLSARDRTHMAHQSGNSQNIQSVGSVLQWLFMFMVPTPPAATHSYSSSPSFADGVSPLQRWKFACGDYNITPDSKHRKNLTAAIQDATDDDQPLDVKRRRI